ncbi:homoserine kinase [Paenibacillus sp. CCS19]|uniref:phosphotransferase enzyme family protein n=1 Tax=Paenibacillus sp. CCS19 TaxID=3158387 RepID=UPI00256ABD56|nr:phosphotransferase [Paenibacillus cellulosilyticus]GMK37231.1 homoserine kinase [Paenibacillus cellulosilyticus]
MIHSAKMDTEEELQDLLAQAKQAALFALQAYHLAWTQIHFIQQSDTITFRIETETDNRYLLRVHTNGMSQEEIQSELVFLNAIGVHEGITVPMGQLSRHATYVLAYTIEQGATLYVTLMRWLDGELLNGGATDTQVRNLGSMIARLHQAAAGFVPSADFARPIWGMDSFVRDLTKLERYHDRFLTTRGWDKYQEAAAKIKTMLAAMSTYEDNYGLIHADLHLGNVIFQGETPLSIDWGRCGYGYYLYDLAGTMIGLYPHQRRVLLEGYESILGPQINKEEILSCFFVMIMIENYCNHVSDPREITGLKEEQPYAQAIIRDFLKGDPFLFNPIEPVIIA